jgi:hypothetical protein
MPVYLCQPGSNASEPWRHGIQVYAAPFSMDEVPMIGGGRDAVVVPASSSDVANWSNTNNTNRNQSGDHQAGSSEQDTTSVASRSTGGASPRSHSGLPIRRVRHAEVVLVDDVCIAYDRYWLRLRWPGHKGGFAGYIALGKVSQPSWLDGTPPHPQGRSYAQIKPHLKSVH